MIEYRHNIEKEAYDMVTFYGKEKSISRCYQLIKEYNDDIKNLPYYDPEKIDALEYNIHYFIDVILDIKNKNQWMN